MALLATWARAGSRLMDETDSLNCNFLELILDACFAFVRMCFRRLPYAVYV